MDVYREIERFVNDLSRRNRAVQFAEGSVSALNILAIFILLGWGLEIIAPHFPYAPLVSTILFVSALSFVVARLSAGALGGGQRNRLLQRVEQKYPQLDDNLINSVRLHDALERRGNQENLSLPLIEKLYSDTAHQLRSIAPGEIIEKRGLKHGALLLIALLSIIIVSVSLNPGFMGRSLALLINPMESVPLGDIYIEMVPRGGYVLKGEDVVLMAFTSGRVPDEVSLSTWKEGEPSTTQKMSSAGAGEFRYVIHRVDKSFNYQARSGPFTSPQYRLEVVEPPMVGNVRIEYHYPEYTGLGVSVQSGSGNILAYKGTEAKISADVNNEEVTGGHIVLQDGARAPLEVLVGGSLMGSIYVLNSGEYWIEVKGEHGFTNKNPVRYPIQVIPDEPPRVEITAPAKDLETDRNSDLNIAYSAGDDFGITRVSLLYRRSGGAEGKEEEIVLEKPQGGNESLFNSYLWDLSSLDLEPGDEVSYRIKVEDNDNISGPKSGTSSSFRITIKGYEKEHQELEAKIEEVNEDLLNLLGDQLELFDKAERVKEKMSGGKASPAEIRMLSHMGDKVMEGADEILRKLDDALKAVMEDPLADSSTYFDLSSLKGALDYTANNLMKEARDALAGRQEPSHGDLGRQEDVKGSDPGEFAEREERITEEMEKIASMADEISRDQKLHDLAGSAKRMLRAQDALLDIMEKLQRGEGEISAVQEELNKLQDMISNMLDALASLSERLPNEFFNSQALETLNFGDLQKGLNNIEEMLRKGDMEGAREAAKELMASLSRMMASLQNMGNMAGEGTMALQDAAEKWGRIFDELLKEQKGILQETVQVDDASSDRMNREKEKNRESLLSRVDEALRRVDDLVDRMGWEAQKTPQDQGIMRELSSMKMGLVEMKRGLYREELEGFDQLVEDLREQFDILQEELSGRGGNFGGRMEDLQKGFKGSLDALKDLSKEIDQLSLKGSALLPPEKEKLEELSGSQGKLKDQAGTLTGAIKEFSAAAPSIGPEITDNMDRAVQEMGSAAGELSDMKPHRASASEREALYRLSRAREALERMQQQMASKRQTASMSMPMIVQGGGQAFPSGSPSDMAQSEGGRMGHSRRDFALPSKEGYTVPPEYREEILKALKEGYPAEYKELLEKYYKNISK